MRELYRYWLAIVNLKLSAVDEQAGSGKVGGEKGRKY